MPFLFQKVTTSRGFNYSQAKFLSGACRSPVSQGTARWTKFMGVNLMSKQTNEVTVEQRPRKASVWRDGIFALVASLGVGLLAASILSVVVFALTFVAVG